MAKNPNQPPAEDKPKKPKKIAEMKLMVFDDGKIDGDFSYKEETETGRLKSWSVDGTDFVKWINQNVSPKALQTLASSVNVQIVVSGLPGDLQGRLLEIKGGKLQLKNEPQAGAFENEVAGTARAPIGSPAGIVPGSKADDERKTVDTTIPALPVPQG